MSALHDLRDLRVGLIGDRSAFVDGGVWTDAGVGRLIDELKSRSARFTLSLSLSPRKKPLHDHRLALAEEDFVPLPWIPSISRGFFQIGPCRRAIRELESRSDVLFVQLPLAAPLALLCPRRPRVYHVVSNVRTLVETSNYYRGPRRLFALAAARVIDAAQTRLIRGKRARCVVHGEELQRHYGAEHCRAVVSSTIRGDEIMSVRRSRPKDGPFRVLFVGYLRHEKGIDTLVEAFSLLLSDVPDAELYIVGAANPVEHGVTADLRTALQTLQQRAVVKFLGHRGFGPELFQCYADADVLAVPSRSEGTPRVLIEARAFGCAVAGSAIGGIPSSIAHEQDGLLVPPGDPIAWRDALLRLARDRSLRDRLTAAGLERARRTTVECFADALAEEALAVVKTEKPAPPMVCRCTQPESETR